jgi:dTDP-glucose 4,6-dehydratase
MISELDKNLLANQVDWARLEDKRILLTGGTGFFGKWLLSAFCLAKEELGISVHVDLLTRNPGGFLKANPFFDNRSHLNFHVGDIRTFDFPHVEYDFIIHGATDADQHLIRSNPIGLFDTIVSGTRRILDLTRRHPSAKFLLISSGGVYGEQPRDLMRIPESYCGSHLPTHWQAPYGEGKRVAEMLCHMYSKEHGLHYSVARCFAFIGPYLPLDRDYAAGNFIANVLRNEDVVIVGDGTPRRSYLYAADLVVWLLRVLLEAQSGATYNVGSDEDISVRDLALAVMEVGKSLGYTKQLIIQKPAIDGQVPARYVPAVDLAKSELGLRIFTPLDQAIAATLQFNRGL